MSPGVCSCHGLPRDSDRGCQVKRRARQARYTRTEKGRARDRRYHESAKGRARALRLVWHKRRKRNERDRAKIAELLQQLREVV